MSLLKCNLKEEGLLTLLTLIYVSVGSRITPSTSEKFEVELYFPVLDKFLHELNHRFQDQNATNMKGI